MAVQDWHVGLDIGSTTITAVAAVRDPAGRLTLVASESAASVGVALGEVTNRGALSRQLALVLGRLEEQTGAAFDRVALSIPGLQLRKVTAAAEGQWPDGAQVEAHMIDAVRRRALRDSGELGVVVAAGPCACLVDGFPVSDPLAGIYCRTLQVDVPAYLVPMPYIDEQARLLAELGVSVDLLMPRAMAVAEATCVPSDDRPSDVVVIDVGGTSTDVVVYLDGAVHTLFSLPVGVRSAAAMASPVATRRRTVAHHAASPAVSWSRAGAAEWPGHATMATHPLVELFRRIRQRLDDLELGQRLTAGAIIAGGGARHPDLLAAARRGLRLPVRLGLPTADIGVSPLTDPALTGLVGVVLAQARHWPPSADPADAPDASVEEADDASPDAYAEATRPGVWPTLSRWLREFVPIGDSE